MDSWPDEDTRAVFSSPTSKGVNIMLTYSIRVLFDINEYLLDYRSIEPHMIELRILLDLIERINKVYEELFQKRAPLYMAILWIHRTYQPKYSAVLVIGRGHFCRAFLK